MGDPDKPKLVFFFDEAHLLFDEAPKALIDRVEQVVRLIRSKGVGVYFITQNPLDVPETVLAQLGNRVQHALRAYTPREQKAVKTAADTFRPNPDFDCAKAITQLGTGEALVSTLEAKGIPAMVQRTLIRPPASRLGPITPRGARQADRRKPGRRPVRQDGRPRVGVRDAAEEGRRRPQRRTAGNRSRPAAGDRPHALDAAGLRRWQQRASAARSAI